MEADDWAEALNQYPQWAIEQAVRWWKGGENPNRRKRPLEGDIAERCNELLMPVRAARIALQGDLVATIPSADPKPLSDAEKEQRRIEAQEIMQKAGFSSRI